MDRYLKAAASKEESQAAIAKMLYEVRISADRARSLMHPLTLSAPTSATYLPLGMLQGVWGLQAIGLCAL